MQEPVWALRLECEALDKLVEGLAAADWQRRTLFFDWTIADEIMHLHLVDLFALQSLRDAAEFAATVREVRAGQARGIELSAQMRARFGHLSAEELRSTWRATWAELCERIGSDEPKRRVSWFGPDMSVRSLTVARQMEVWAHGQDVFDLLRIRRINTDSLYNICDLGVRTFQWSFQNRGERPADAAPRVSLQAPSGSRWSWNEAQTQSIEGSAEEFALVVTQRRNVADTALQVEGSVARRWMSIAQCFAGAPETPPAPGARVMKTV
jgi:uncharacterized protein (TIGR03084 family)